MKSSVVQFQTELEILIRARYPVIYCASFEETRVTNLVAEISNKRGGNLLVWTRTDGFVDEEGNSVEPIVAPDKALKYVQENKKKVTFVLKDFHPFLKDITIVRKLRDLCHSLKTTQKNIILVSPTPTVPLELSKEIVVLNMPLPGRQEIAQIYEKISADLGVAKEISESRQEACIEAAIGLTEEEIENVFAKSLVKFGEICVPEILAEKRQIVQKAGILDFIPVDGDFETIGGVKNLKDWLKRRKDGFSKKARDLKLPSPKGLLMVGIPGCGKSLAATCTGAAWEMPLLRLDMGKVFSGLVGSSEQNLRGALQTAEAVSPCILWIDEIEKGMAGSSGSSGDGGTSQRVFGSFLTWMQEKTEPVFVLATANDISGLPPEMLRKGRFDEIFYVDLPQRNERHDILQIHLSKRDWTIDDYKKEQFLKQTEGFSGAEIEQVLLDARYEAFFLEEPLNMNHIQIAAKRTVPLSKTMKEKIDGIREWASHRAVPASAKETSSQQAGSMQRAVEMEGM